VGGEIRIHSGGVGLGLLHQYWTCAVFTRCGEGKRRGGNLVTYTSSVCITERGGRFAKERGEDYSQRRKDLITGKSFSKIADTAEVIFLIGPFQGKRGDARGRGEKVGKMN